MKSKLASASLVQVVLVLLMRQTKRSFEHEIHDLIQNVTA